MRCLVKQWYIRRLGLAPYLPRYLLDMITRVGRRGLIYELSISKYSVHQRPLSGRCIGAEYQSNPTRMPSMYNYFVTRDTFPASLATLLHPKTCCSTGERLECRRRSLVRTSSFDQPRPMNSCRKCVPAGLYLYPLNPSTCPTFERNQSVTSEPASSKDDACRSISA